MSEVQGPPPPTSKRGKGDRLLGLDARGREAISDIGERYSFFVGLMRFVLPAIAVALFALVVVWPLVTGNNEGFRLTFSAADPSDTGPLKMVNARYIGVDDHDQPYTVTADLVLQESAEADLVELVQPKADITLADGGWLLLTAERGFYDRTGEVLNLEGAVNTFSDTGLEFRTESATIELTRGIAFGHDPVEGQGPLGVLNAEGFRVGEGGQTIDFDGPVTLVIYPSSGHTSP